ncbi:DeoR/GlpR family DNA-binding transcription regulator [Christensenella timonensis]|uniref:DeoR/GlpR family DNA-binding transcription regulator n=1 Tax=Christensenella timonensis TaxID=1816678 RepID=UPI0008351937|nr:DeoR/GlpR family DNA-binding transcription regulator [Christensenella timonensis]
MKRREEIKELLKERGEITLRELEAAFPDCSGVTLRRDLKFLEEQGALKRTHGGAVALHKLSLEAENVFSQRATECVGEKCQIAKKAVKFIEPGRSIYIDAGSTMMQFVKEMPDEYLSVLTSGVNIALELIKKQKLSVTLIGGQVNRNTVAVSGTNCTRFIQEVNIDTAFLAASGFSIENGFTTGTYTEAEIKKEVLGRARRVIILMDSNKMGKVLPFTFANMEDIEVLVSDDGLDKNGLRVANSTGVEIV